jgi:large subunit ribosomal protein L33
MKIVSYQSLYIKQLKFSDTGGSMAKGPRVIITLECTEARKIGKSPSRYTTTKNKKTHPERLELKKYNPSLRKHTLHKEIK